MEPARTLAAFDAQVRRSVRPDGSGALIQADRNVVRWLAVDGRGWSGITWSQLDEADADRVIAEQVAYVGDRAEKFEWKLYDYDQPPDLARRLLAAAGHLDLTSRAVSSLLRGVTERNAPPAA